MLTAIYDKNIEVLKNIDIVLATKIIQASIGDIFELSIVSQKHHLFNIYDTFQECMLYEDIIEELKECLTTLNSQANKPFVYLFGMGNAYYLPTLLENHNHQRIVIIEPELEILFVALHLYDFSHELSLGRLKLFHQKSLDFAQATHLFSEHQAKHHARSFSLIPTSPYYESYFSDSIIKVNGLLVDALGFKISQVAKSFDTELENLLNHRFNLASMLNAPSYANFIKQKHTESIALILYATPTDEELVELKALRKQITLISVQELLPDLLSRDILPDIVTASHYNHELWSTLKPEHYQQVTLILSSHHKHPNSENISVPTILTVDERYKYFDLKEHGYTFAYHDAQALEIAYELKHSQCFIYSHKPLSLKHAYLSHLYKKEMSISTVNQEKASHLHAYHRSFVDLANMLKSKTFHKKTIIHEVSHHINQARHDLKLTHLIAESHALYTKLTQQLDNLEVHYPHYLQEDSDKLSLESENSDMELFLNDISTIKNALAQNMIYQRFLHDFFYPSSLLYFIEMATIQTSAIYTQHEEKHKALAWATIHYQWFKELINNLSLMLAKLMDEEKAIA
jgi:hypothetical protein